MIFKLIKILFPILIVFLLHSCKKDNDFSKKAIYDINKDIDKTSIAVIDTLKTPKHLNKIIADISLINTYQTGILAKGKTNSRNFENLKNLEKDANQEELLYLTDNKNAVVSLYSSLILIKENYKNIDKIFLKLLAKNKSIETKNGCIVGKDKSYIPFYNFYLQSLKDEDVTNDFLLKKMDSLIIYHKNSNHEILRQVLKNRLYPIHYNNQIKRLAFVEKKEPAILYLSKWYKAQYKNQLQSEVIKLLDQDSLNSFYYKKYLQELLSFDNIKNKKFIINKLKKDTIWKIDEFEFYNLLSRNGISPDEIDEN